MNMWIVIWTLVLTVPTPYDKVSPNSFGNYDKENAQVYVTKIETEEKFTIVTSTPIAIAFIQNMPANAKDVQYYRLMDPEKNYSEVVKSTYTVTESTDTK